MSDSNQLDFSFRYRPKVDSPDAILIRYLLSFKPRKRKDLILKALRAFYLMPAYGKLGEINKPSELEDLARSLREIYENDYEDFHQFEIDIKLEINLEDYWGMMTLPRGSGDDDDDD